MTAPTGLARVTISAPRRRIDVALPEHVPVAELLPELLRHAGEAMADDGERHGGWLLRRTSGDPVQPAQGLHAQGVRDGEVLHLVPAHAQWPELEYDDVVEAIAAGAREVGRGWSPSATRVAAAAGAAVVLGIGLVALLLRGPQWTAASAVGLGVAVALLLAGVAAARAYGAGPAGAALAAYALPYAWVGGAALVAAPGPVWAAGPPGLLTGSTALLLAALLGAAGTAAALRVFAAGVTMGALGAAGALLAFWLPAPAAASIVTAVLACGIGVVPLLAIRFGKLPMPPVTLPPGTELTSGDGGDAGLAAIRQRPEPTRVRAAVRRTDELLTGMLLGLAAVSIGSSVVLARGGGPAGRLLVGVTATVLLLRSRLFAAVRHRVSVLVAGLASMAVLAVTVVATSGSGTALALLGAAVVVGLLVVVAGTTYSRRAPSPYLGRAADLLDTLLVVSVVPIAAAVLDLYAKVRGIAG